MFSFLSIKMWLAVGVAAAFLALGGAWWVRGVQLKDARADIKSLEADVEAAKVTIAAQQSALKECSDRTDALKVEGVKRQAAADQALLQAQQEAQRYQESNKRLGALLKAPTPSVAGAAAGAVTVAGCSQAMQELRKELRK